MSASLPAFDFRPTTRVVFGPGTIDRLGELARELGGRRVLVVTDPGVRAAGHIERGVQSLTEAGLDPTVFDRVAENPTTRHVDACVAAARTADADLLVGFGGGSSMDTAKGANFLLTNGGQMTDYWGVGKATKPMLPMIAVPTTAGTGSEAQSFALIAHETTHQKMACGDKKAACKVAILDPLVTLSKPARVTAVVGIDAIAHALESYVTARRNAVSIVYAREAWRLLRAAYPMVLAEPDLVEGRAAMLLGAHWAGAAIENSMLGAAHGAANPLTAHFGITHGIAVGVMLPWVLRFNAEAVGDLYAELVDGAGNPGARLAGLVTGWLAQAGLPTTLEECGVEPNRLTELANEAAKQWTASFNPRPITAADFVDLYREAYN